MKSKEELLTILDEMIKVTGKYHLLNSDRINLFMFGLERYFSKSTPRDRPELKYVILNYLRIAMENISKLEN